MAEPLLVTDADTLDRLAGRLAARSRIALDTEAASFHRYEDRVYLVQLSSDDETAIVDPLAVEDLTPVGALLADPGTEVLFHDADYDLRILDRDYGFRARRVWDTRIAAQLAGEPAFGLGSLLEKYFDIRLSKKLQRADWSRRPLTDEMIAYAAADTAHLPALRDLLEVKLSDLGRLRWAEEEFRRLEDLRWTGADGDAQPWFRLKGAKQLRGESVPVLMAVWRWRERTAKAMDRAPFRVLSNDAVVDIARTLPRTADALRQVSGVGTTTMQRHADELLDAVEAGRALPTAAWPTYERKRGTRPAPEEEERYQRLRALRAKRAEALELDPGLIGPNATLMAIARAAPASAAELEAVDDLRGWQREALGEPAILSAVAG